jgi:hypothetical protein
MIEYVVYTDHLSSTPTAAAATDGSRLFTVGIDLKELSPYEAAYLREGLAQGRKDVILAAAGAGRRVLEPRQAVDADPDEWESFTEALQHRVEAYTA